MRTYALVGAVTGLLVVAAVFRQVAATAGEPKAGAVKPTQEWRGSVEDDSLQKECPAQGLITNEETFAKLWRAWRPSDKVPAVDFKKELAVVETTKGSILRVTARLGQNADLRVMGIATRDFRPGFRYHLLVVPREGVKTVNGKELPKD